VSCAYTSFKARLLREINVLSSFTLCTVIDIRVVLVDGRDKFLVWFTWFQNLRALFQFFPHSLSLDLHIKLAEFYLSMCPQVRITMNCWAPVVVRPVRGHWMPVTCKKTIMQTSTRLCEHAHTHARTAAYSRPYRCPLVGWDTPRRRTSSTSTDCKQTQALSLVIG
jgi:hypothetical protein